MKILIDMNLSPEWVAIFAHHGIRRSTGRPWVILALKIQC